MKFISKSTITQIIVVLCALVLIFWTPGTHAQYQYLLNPASYSQTFDSYGDQHTVGSILQPQGGRVRRYDGQTDYYGRYNAYNNPSVYPSSPQFGSVPNFGFFGRR